MPSLPSNASFVYKGYTVLYSPFSDDWRIIKHGSHYICTCASAVEARRIINELLPNGEGIMQKIVINVCFGGFSLSEEACLRLSEKIGEKVMPHWNGPRDNPHLVHLVESMGDAADGRFARLKVVLVPDDVQWTVEKYNGSEWVAEKHRTWS